MEAIIQQQNMDQMKDFPCAFNLEGTRTLSHARLNHVHENLVSDLKNQRCCQSEIIRRNNLLTLILFLLDRHGEAEQLNAESINLANSSNLACLGNHFFLLCLKGDELGADQCLQDLQKMKDRESYSNLLTEAKAEQAYYYSRLGGLENLKRAIRLFSEAIAKVPCNNLWKFGLGLCYQRTLHANIFCCSSQPFDVEGYKKLAADCLFDVVEKADSRLKSLAYAHLVTLWGTHPAAGSDVFRGLSILELCESALKHDPDNPSMLTHCGNVIREFDIEKSITMLQKALTVRKNNITYHYLGISYHKKAEQETMNTIASSDGQLTNQLEKSIQEIGGEHDQCLCENTELQVDCEQVFVQSQTVKSLFGKCKVKEINEMISNTSSNARKKQHLLSVCVRSHAHHLCLNKDSPLVINALECYKKAMELSKINAPAIYDYGMLLKQTGQLNEAVIQFNKVTHIHVLFAQYGVSVISAYEQIGLCYLELSKSQQSNNHLVDRAKEKLTTSISLAENLALINPVLKNSAKEVWIAFRTLEAEINQTTSSAKQTTERIKLLQLVRDYGGIIDVVQKLLEYSDSQLNNQSIITAALESYLYLKQPENALALLKLVAITSGARNSTWWNTTTIKDLRTKVYFHALSACMREARGNPTPLFQQLFELTFGTRYGLNADGDTDAEAEYKGDILIVFDDEEESDDDGPRSIKKVADCIKEAAFRLFGLETEVNLQVCATQLNMCS